MKERKGKDYKAHGLARGKATVFSMEEERLFVERLQFMTDIGWGLDPESVRMRAFEFATKLGKPSIFNQQKQMAGRSWYDGFMTRHDDLRKRISENLSKA